MIYRKLIRPLLFSLSIERAHRLVLVALRALGAVPGGRWLLRSIYAVEHPSLEREVFGVRFPNPVGLAAGFDRNAEACREWAALGFGFVEVGTITPAPQGGNPRPRVFRLPRDRAIVNRIGLANRGLKRALHYLRRPRKGVIVGCNIGKNGDTAAENAAADYLKCFRNLYQYADYFTVNMSCDNCAREGSAYSREHILRILEPLFEFRRGQNQYRPVMLKISPDLDDETVDRITDILLETPLDGIVAANGSHRREGLSTSRVSVDCIGNGRLSGAPLTERTVELIRRIHVRSGGSYPIIASGGVMTAEDARRMLDAGADLVQLYTGIIYEGPELIGEICRSLICEAEELDAMCAAEASMQEPEETEAAEPSAGTAVREEAAGAALPSESASSKPTEAPSAAAAPAAPRDASDNR